MEAETDFVKCVEEREKSLAGHYFAYIGTIVHELSHYIACLITGVHVTESRLLLPPNKQHIVGYIIHRRAPPFEQWFIAIAPLFLCNLIAFFLFADATRALNSENYIYLTITLWLGASIAWRGRASGQDLRIAWKHAGNIWTKYPVTQRIFIILLTPIIYSTLIIGEIRERYFTNGLGGLIWIVSVFIIAKSYVAVTG